MEVENVNFNGDNVVASSLSKANLFFGRCDN
jgi:hypothetical protein